MTASEERRASLKTKPKRERFSRIAELSPIVQKLCFWMKSNHLSQRQAAAVMGMHDLPVSIPSIQSWEQGVTSPGKLAAKALETFLEQHPKITDPPVYGRWKSPNKDVAEIRELRKSGMTLLSIAQRFGISESAVSRICAGNRRAKEN